MKRTAGQDRSITQKWRPATQAVRGGTWRSEMGETSEALFLTSGFTYDDAATVAARFAGEAEGMTYSRLQNPTVQMLEERIALMEGAEACRTQATGMAAMTTALLCQLSAGDHVVAGAAPDQVVAGAHNKIIIRRSNSCIGCKCVIAAIALQLIIAPEPVGDVVRVCPEEAVVAGRPAEVGHAVCPELCHREKSSRMWRSGCKRRAGRR